MANTPIPITIPVAIMQAGQKLGPFASSAFGSAFATWMLTLTPTLWPAGDVLEIDVEYSTDGGQTWHAEGGSTFGGGNTSAAVWMSIHRGGATALDMVRFTLNPLQTCAATFALVGIPAAVGQAVKL